MMQERRVGASRSLSLALAALAFTTVLNVLLPVFISTPPANTAGEFSQRSEIKIESNHLHEWNLPLKQVALTVEDSVNFQLDTLEGAAQWRALQPSGDGYITLEEGPNKVRSRVAMFHALDCLDIVRQNVLQRKADRNTPASAEAHYCLDYLRQTIQCRSDIQLEQVRSEYGGKSVQPFVTHSDCRDWSTVYAELERLAQT